MRRFTAMDDGARRDLAFGALTLVLFIAVTAAFPAFASPGNVAGLLDDTAILIMLALAQMLVILVRGIDLSIAANLALCGMLAALFNRAFPELGVLPVLLLTLVAGGLLGALNGLLVWKLKLPPIVVTLGTMSIYRGVIFLLSKGAWVNENEMSRGFLAFPRHHWGEHAHLMAGAGVVNRGAAGHTSARDMTPTVQSHAAEVRYRSGRAQFVRTRSAARLPASAVTCGWRVSPWRIPTSRWASSCRSSLPA